jgi:hypothetical protein
MKTKERDNAQVGLIMIGGTGASQNKQRKERLGTSWIQRSHIYICGGAIQSEIMRRTQMVVVVHAVLQHVGHSQLTTGPDTVNHKPQHKQIFHRSQCIGGQGNALINDRSSFLSLLFCCARAISSVKHVCTTLGVQSSNTVFSRSSKHASP